MGNTLFMKTRYRLRELLLLLLPLLFLMIGFPSASATETLAQTVTPTPAPSLYSGSIGGGKTRVSTVVLTVAIVCSIATVVIIGIIGVCTILRDKLAREEDGDEEEGGGLEEPSRQSSYASKASYVVPFAGSVEWRAADDEGKAWEGGVERTANPLYAATALKSTDGGFSDRSRAGSNLSIVVGGGSGSTRGASTSSEHTPDESGGGSFRRGICVHAGAGAREGLNESRNERHDSSSASFMSRSGISRGRKQRVVPQLSADSSLSSTEGDDGDAKIATIGTNLSVSACGAATYAPAPSPAPAASPAFVPTPTPAPLPSPASSDVPLAPSSVRKSLTSLAAPGKGAVPRNFRRPSLNTENSEEEFHVDSGPEESVGRRRLIHGGSPTVGAGRDSSGRFQAGSGTSVLSAAEDVVRGAEALARESFVPGVKEVSVLVAGLARLSAAHHRGNAVEMEERVAWCRSVVRTLERARDVLARSAPRRGEAERILLEDVQDSIRGMAEIVQSYKNKHMVTEVFASALCRRRQDEAEEATTAAETYLEAFESVPKMPVALVSPGHTLRPISQEAAEDLRNHIKVLQEMLVKSIRKRRRRGVDQADIPFEDIDVMTEEILGVGGFGYVYLADYRGCNAAAKEVWFLEERSGDDSPSGATGGNSFDDSDDMEYSLDQKQRRQVAVANAKKAYAKTRAETRERLAFLRELEAMKRLRGPNTVHLYGAVTSTKDRFVLVMELLPGGNLRHRLRKAKGPLDDRTLRRIVKDVCSGMAFLHAEAFVHGDLKSAAVLFDAAGNAKIGDLGTLLWTQRATRIATYSYRHGGLMSLPWAAPEVLNREGATSKSDVYSFGIVLWECLTRKLPWQNVASVGKLLYLVTGGERPVIPPDAPADLAALAEACWANDPATRPSLERVLADLDARRVTSAFVPPAGRSAPRPPMARAADKAKKLAGSTGERLTISENSWSPRSFATARNTFGVAAGKRGRLLYRRSSSGGSSSRSVPVIEEEKDEEEKAEKEERGEYANPKAKSEEVEGARGGGRKDDFIEAEQEEDEGGDVAWRFKRDPKKDLRELDKEKLPEKSDEEDRRLHRWIMQSRRQEQLLKLKRKKRNSTRPWADDQDDVNDRQDGGRVKKTLERSEFTVKGDLVEEGGKRVSLGRINSGEQRSQDLRQYFRDPVDDSIGHLSGDERTPDAPTYLARRPRARVKSTRIHSEK